jgi:hypothetical protein
MSNREIVRNRAGSLATWEELAYLVQGREAFFNGPGGGARAQTLLKQRTVGPACGINPRGPTHSKQAPWPLFQNPAERAALLAILKAVLNLD